MSLSQTINGTLRRVPAWPLYLLGAVPALWLLWQGVNGGLGVDPVKEIEHELGKIALQLIIAGLCVTPLRMLTGVSLIRYRRAIGVLAFSYVALHLTTWLVLDIQLRWSEIWADIVKRPYITIGMAGFLMMLPLAITSNNLMVRRLGAMRWQRLHWLTYPAAISGAVHYVMVVKAWPPEPLIYAAIIVGLLLVRKLPKMTLSGRPGRRVAN